MNVNQAAFCTTTLLAGAAIATTFAAATTATTVATVAYSILAIFFGAISIASITAWVDRNSTDVSKYFSNMQHHAGYAIAGTFQFVAQTLIQGLIQGMANGLSKAMQRKIAGEDVTIKTT